MRLKGQLKKFYKKGIADLFITAAEIWHKDVPKIMVWAGADVLGYKISINGLG
jgi:hypothetical protein